MCLICDRIDLIKKGENPYLVKEYETGYAVIGDHQHFYGYTLFLAKEHISELSQLDHQTRLTFLAEMSDLAAAVERAFPADKLNLELLGNGDAHCHWHIFPRRAGDLGPHGLNGKGPVWWLPFEDMYADDKKVQPDQLADMVAKLQEAIEQT